MTSNTAHHAISQSAHEKCNIQNYPGTRQLCIKCDEPTGNCEEDALYFEVDGEDIGPLCGCCWHRLESAS